MGSSIPYKNLFKYAYMEHTFSFPEIPSHCESPFRRDFPPGLTQAASRPVTQAGALPAQPHILHCSVQKTA